MFPAIRRRVKEGASMATSLLTQMVRSGGRSYHAAGIDSAAQHVSRVAQQIFRKTVSPPGNADRFAGIGMKSRIWSPLEKPMRGVVQGTLEAIATKTQGQARGVLSLLKRQEDPQRPSLSAPSSHLYALYAQSSSQEMAKVVGTDALGLMEDEILRLQETDTDHTPGHVQEQSRANEARIEEKLSTTLGVELVLSTQDTLSLSADDVMERERSIQQQARDLLPLPTHGSLSRDTDPQAEAQRLTADVLQQRATQQRERTAFENTFRGMDSPTDRDRFLFGTDGCLSRLSYDQLVFVGRHLRDIGDHETVVILRNELLMTLNERDSEARDHALRFLNDPFQTTAVAQSTMNSVYRNPRAAQALLETVVRNPAYNDNARAEATAQLGAAQALQATAGMRLLQGQNNGVTMRDFQRCWGQQPGELESGAVKELLQKAADSYQEAFILSGASRPNYLALAARASQNLANLSESEELARAAQRQAQVLAAQGVLNGMQEAAPFSTDISKVRGMYEAALLLTAHSPTDLLPGQDQLYNYAAEIIPTLEQRIAELCLPQLQEVKQTDPELVQQKMERWNQSQLEGTERRVSATSYSLGVLSETLERAAQGPLQEGMRDLREALDGIYHNPDGARTRLAILAERSPMMEMQGRSAAESSMRYVGSMEMGGLIASSVVDDKDLEWRRSIISQKSIQELAQGAQYAEFSKVCETYKLDPTKPLNQIVDSPLDHEQFLQAVRDLVSRLAHDHYDIKGKGLENLHGQEHRDWEVIQLMQESVRGIGFPEMDAQERRQARIESGGAPTNVSTTWSSADGDCRYTNFAAAQLMQELINEKRRDFTLKFMETEIQRREGDPSPAVLQTQNELFEQMVDYSRDLVITTEVRVYADIAIEKMWDQPQEQDGLPKQGSGLKPVEDHTITGMFDGSDGTLLLGCAFYHEAYQFNQGQATPLSLEEKSSRGLDPNKPFWFAGSKTVMGADGKPTQTPVVIGLAPYAPPLLRSGFRVARSAEPGALHYGLRVDVPPDERESNQ